MNDQTPKNNNNNSNRRPHNNNHNDQRRRHHNNNGTQNRARPQGQNQESRPDSSNQQATGNHQGQSGNNNRRKNNFRRNRNQRRPANPEVRGPIPTTEKRPGFLDRAYEKYQNLLDQHLIARKKYFELFYRADPQQKNKLERNFYQTLNDLRDYEEKLTPETKEFLEFKTNGKAIDTIYSNNHELLSNGSTEIENDKIEDPHLLASQIKADYSKDTEESNGTLEDYKMYKGI